MSKTARDKVSPKETSGQQGEPVSRDARLYNSRLALNYIEYLQRFHNDVDIDELLALAGTNRAEASDPSHWYDQKSVNRFHDAMDAQISDPELCRKAGRFGAHARAMGTIKQIAIGLLNPGHFYQRIDRVMNLMTRGAEGSGRLIGPNRAEVITVPKPGVEEQLFQCQNRFGSLEGAGYIFLGEYPKIEHPECVHRGDECCRYLISWEKTPTSRWQRYRTLSVIAGAIVTLTAFPFLALSSWLLATTSIFALVMAVHGRYAALRVEQLQLMAENQGQHAHELIDEVNTRHAHGKLLQSVAEASSRRLPLERFLEQVIIEIGKVLPRDELLIALEAPGGTMVQTVTTSTGSEGAETRHYRPGHQPERPLSENSVTVPIVYDDHPLGHLQLSRARGEKTPSQAERVLLEGLAAQIAVGVNNARAFRDVEASEKKYRDLVESATSAILRFEPEGTLTFINSFAQELFELPSSSVERESLFGMLFPDSKEARQALQQLLRDLEKHPAHLSVMETTPASALATQRSIAWTFKGISDAANRIDEVLAIGADITALREADYEREKLSRQLDQVQKLESIGTLAGGIAHDFNNLLTGIMGNIVVLLERHADEQESHQMLCDIETLARSASDLTKQLLGFARKGKYEIVTTDVNTLIDGTLRLFARTHKELDHRLDLVPEPWLVRADRSQIEQTLFNIFINAKQAMPKGGCLGVTTTNVRIDDDRADTLQLTPGPYISIAISDNGVGMKPEVLKRIFEPFFTTKELERGTGLGLASAYGVVRSHGGMITVTSAVGQGSTFEIFLPAVPETTVDEPDERPKTVKGTGTLLVVDDEVLVLKAARRVLRQLGYDVLIAPNGERALELYAFQGDTIDLVILDMIMPNMDGPEVFAALKELDPDVRVLLSSGYSIGDEAARVLEQGAVGFLQKPYDDNQLSTKLHDVLGSLSSSLEPSDVRESTEPQRPDHRAERASAKPVPTSIRSR